MGSDSKVLTLIKTATSGMNKHKEYDDLSRSKHSKLTKEEEILLQDFSRNVSTKSSALFYGNGFIISAIQAWIFWRIFPIEPIIPLFIGLFVVLTILSTLLVAFAYKNVKFVLKHKFAQKREDAITKEILSSLTSATPGANPLTKETDETTPAGQVAPTIGLAASISAKKMISKKDRDERILWKKNEVSDYEATTYSIFYNNALFLLCFLVSSCFFFIGFQPAVNYGVSMLLASGLTALFSTGTS